MQGMQPEAARLGLTSQCPVRSRSRPLNPDLPPERDKAMPQPYVLRPGSEAKGQWDLWEAVTTVTQARPHRHEERGAQAAVRGTCWRGLRIGPKRHRQRAEAPDPDRARERTQRP